MKFKLIFIVLFLIFLVSVFAIGEIGKDIEKIDTVKEIKSLEKLDTFSEVQFTVDISSKRERAELESAIKTSWKRIEIDSTKYPELNKPAKITFKNVCYQNPILTRNGRWVEDSDLHMDGLCSWSANVDKFSYYTIAETNFSTGTHDNTTIDDDGNLILDIDAIGIYDFRWQGQSSGYVNDSSLDLNNVDTTNPTSYKECKYADVCYDFDGTNDYMFTDDYDLNYSNTNYTVSLWVYVDDNSTSQRVISMPENGAGCSSTGLGISSGEFRFSHWNSTDYITKVKDDINENQWYHVMFTSYNNDSVYLWVDGVELTGTGSSATQSCNNNKQLILGARGDLLSPFDGKIECVHIWEDIGDEALALYYNDSQVCGSEAVVYYSFQEEDATDFSGSGNDGNEYNTFYVSDEYIGSALDLDGTGYIDLSDKELTNDKDFTFTFWINPVNQLSSIINKHNASGQGVGNAGFVTVYYNTIEELKFFQYNTSGNNDDVKTSLPIDMWSFITITRQITNDNANISIYLNGTLKESIIIENYQDSPFENLTIGKYSYVDGTYFNGTLDEIGIWERVLTNLEIENLYNEGTGLDPYRLMTHAYSMEDYEKNVWDTYGDLGTNYYPLDTSAWHSWGEGLFRVPLLYLDFEYGNESVDLSPHDNLVNYSWGGGTEYITKDEGVNGYGLQMNTYGDNPGIRLNQDQTKSFILDNGTEFTASIWFKPKDSSHMGLMGNTHQSSGNYWQWWMRRGGIYDTFCGIGNGTNIQQLPRYGAGKDLDEWVHLVCSYNGSHLISWRDGSKASIAVTLKNPMTPRMDGLSRDCIGSTYDCTGTEAFNGTLDDAIIWDYALNDTQVEYLYNSTAMKRFQSYEFDGNDDYVDLGNLGLGVSDLTVALWYRIDSGIAETVVSFSRLAYEDILKLVASTTDTYLYNREGAGGSQITYSGVDTNDGEWHHVAFTRQGYNASIYVDGEYKASSNSIENQANVQAINFIGVSQDGSGGMEGFVDDLFIFDRILTPTEIQDLMDGEEYWYYKKEAMWTSKEYNATDYDPDIMINNWNNMTTVHTEPFPSTAMGQGESRINNCGLLDGTWTNMTTVSATLSLIDKQTELNECIQGRIRFWNFGGDNTMIIANFSLNNFKYNRPYAIGSNFWGGENTTQPIWANATFEINDTDDNGTLEFRWFVNGVQVTTENFTGLANDDVATASLNESYFVKDDEIYVQIYPHNPPVEGNYYQFLDGNQTIGDASFTSSYVPTNTTVNLEKPRWRKFKATVVDLDGDAVTSWYVDGSLVDTGATHNFYSTKYEDYDILNFTAITTDNNHTTQYYWTVNITPADINVVAGIAIVIFILAVTGGLFILPFKKRFSKNEFANMVLKRGCWVIAIYLMMLNSSIMATIASASGMDLTGEMFRYMWLFGVAGYVFMGFMVLMTLVNAMQMWKVKKNKQRMGDEDE